MAFGDSAKRGTGDTTQNRVSPFLKTTPGEHVIRVLDEEETSFWRYWLPVNMNGTPRGTSLTVARDNPIRTMMEALPEGDKKFQKPSRRFYLNVLELTPVVKLPDGKFIYPNERGEYINSVDGKDIVLDAGNAEPSERVKIFEFGVQVLNALVSLNGRMRSRRNRTQFVSIHETDIVLIVNGEGTDKTVTPTQGQDETPLREELLKLPRYDLKKMVTPIPNHLLENLINGGNFADVQAEMGWTQDYPTYIPQ